MLGIVQGPRDTAISKTIVEQEKAVHLPDVLSDRTQNTNRRVKRNEIERKRAGNGLKLKGLKCRMLLNRRKIVGVN